MIASEPHKSDASERPSSPDASFSRSLAFESISSSVVVLVSEAGSESPRYLQKICQNSINVYQLDWLIFRIRNLMHNRTRLTQTRSIWTPAVSRSQNLLILIWSDPDIILPGKRYVSTASTCINSEKPQMLTSKSEGCDILQTVPASGKSVAEECWGSGFSIYIVISNLVTRYSNAANWAAICIAQCGGRQAAARAKGCLAYLYSERRY